MVLVWHYLGVYDYKRHAYVAQLEVLDALQMFCKQEDLIPKNDASVPLMSSTHSLYAACNRWPRSIEAGVNKRKYSIGASCFGNGGASLSRWLDASVHTRKDWGRMLLDQSSSILL